MSEKSTLSRLVSGGALRTASLLINIVIAFLMMPFVVQHLGDRWYGLWLIVGSLIGYYGYLDFGLSSASQRFIAKAINSDDLDVNTIASTSFSLFTGLSLCTMLLTLAIIFLAPEFVDNPDELTTFQIVILILGLKTAIMFPFMVFNGVISAHLRYDIATYINVAKLLLRTALIVIYLSMDYSIVALAVITLLTETVGYVAIAICANKIHHSLKISYKSIDRKLYPQFFNYSKYTFIASMGDVLRFKIDNLVIANYIGLAMVTHYAIAIRLIDYIGQLLTAILGMFLPIFTKYDAQGKDEEMREKFLIVTEISVFLTLLCVPPLMILGDVFIKLWMGEQYLDSYIPMLILAVASIFAGCNRVCVTVLYAKAKHKYYAKVNLFEGVVNLGLSLILVSYFGIVGVAMGTAIATVYVKAILLPKYTCKVLELPLANYYKILFRHLSFALIYYPVSYWLYGQFKVDTYITLITFSALLCSIYIIISFAVFSSELKIHLAKLRPKKSGFPFFQSKKVK